MIDSQSATLGGLSPQDVTSYWQQGYLLLRAPFSRTDVRRMQAECDRLMTVYGESDESNLRAQTRPSELGKSVLDRFDPIVDISTVFAEVARAKRLMQPIASLFGAEARLFKDKLIYKRPGTHGYDVHQDYTYWHELNCPPDGLLSALVAIDASHAGNGVMEIYPGLHRELFGGRQRPQGVFDPKQGLVSERDLAGITPLAMPLEPGDVLLFHSLAPHRSGVNRSETARRSLFLTYSDSRYGDLYEAYYRKFHEYLRGDRSNHGSQLHFH